jgi:hypothetical protein
MEGQNGVSGAEVKLSFTSLDVFQTNDFVLRFSLTQVQVEEEYFWDARMEICPGELA